MKARLIAGMTAALLLAVAMATVGVRDAKAWGNYGAYDGADVYCDPTGGVQITAHVGRWSGFTAQDVGFTHKMVEIDTRETRYLTINWAAWFTFRHTESMYNLPYTDRMFTWSGQPAGRWIIYTKYAWFDGYWRTTDWVPARYYQYPYGGAQSCITRNPTLSDFGW